MMLLYIIVVLQLMSLTGASESGIVEGNESKAHSRPYMAELQINPEHAKGWHVCGGVLIRKDFVLTAAHCIDRDENGNAYDITVVLGAHDRTKDEKSQQKIPAELIPHPDYAYNKNNHKNDIMLLKLKRNAKLNENVTTIGLPKMDEIIPARDECLVIGWGQTGPGTLASKVLREAKVKMEFNDECKSKWDNYFSGEQMICTYAMKKTVGIWQGDSGGPLICDGKAHGISAFVDVVDWNTKKYRPNVFMKVPFFIKWIEKVMEKK